MPGPGVCAVVLAAGAASRFGGAKQLATVGGVAMARRVVEAAQGAVGVDEVVVVLGAQADAVRVVLPGRGEHVVVAEDWAEGLSASLGAGLRAVPAGQAALVLLADQPLVDAALIAEIVARGLPGLGETHEAARPVRGGVPGHPVLLGPRAQALASNLSGDQGLGGVLRDLALLQIRVEGGQATFDVDRPEDLAAAERALGGAEDGP